MLGKRRVRQENLFGVARRETRVSRELRALKQMLDFDYFREQVKDKFCLDNGRPSIAPETLMAMMFLGYWFNITSDRELCDECEDRLSFREFIGLNDDDEIPVHSSLTHWRQRLGREPFQMFLARTVEIAKEQGLKPGRCRVFDSSLVKAQADTTGPATAVLDPVRDANDYLDALGDWQPEARDRVDTPKGKGSGKLSRYEKRKLSEGRKIKVNAHDPDAKFIRRKGKKADFYHKAHFEFDTKTELVMNADAGHEGDAEKMVEFLSRESEAVDTVGGDTGYFTAKSQIWLKGSRIDSFISVRDNAENRGVAFGLEAFSYVKEQDLYVCPGGLKLTRQDSGQGTERRYAGPRGSCAGCEYYNYCFQSGVEAGYRQLGLSSSRSIVEEAKVQNQSYRYQRIMKKRSIICEGSIGRMKSYGGLGRARAVGNEATAIQVALAATVHNMKKILRHVGWAEKGAMSDVFACIACFMRYTARKVARRIVSWPKFSIRRAIPAY